jgi:hypothetical protein
MKTNCLSSDIYRRINEITNRLFPDNTKMGKGICGSTILCQSMGLGAIVLLLLCASLNAEVTTITSHFRD